MYGMRLSNIMIDNLADKYIHKIERLTRFRWFYHFFLLILGILPVTWFYNDYVIRPEELSFVNYSFLLEKYLYAWSTHTSNGLPSTYANQLILFPVGILYSALQKLNIAEQQTQKILLVLIFESTLFVSFKLFNKIGRNNKLAFIASVFYVYNFYTLSIPFYTAKMIQLFMIPSVFLITLNYLESKKVKYIFINFILVFVLQGIFSNIANALSTLIIYPLAISFYIYSHRKTNVIKQLIPFFLLPLIIIINIGLIFYYSVLSNDLYIKFRDTNAFSHTFLSTKLSKIFTLFHGAWWETSEIYNPWYNHFNNPIIIIISVIVFSLLIIGFITTKNDKESNRLYIFWLLGFLLFIYLAKGISQPFGSVYKLMFFNIPGFFVFREPWAKFTPLVMFSGSIVLLYTLKSIAYRTKVITLILLAILLINLPFLNGKAISHSGFGYSDNDILIPEYWKDIHRWSENDDTKNLNIFTTPIIYGTQEYYNWQGYEKGNLTGSFVYTYLYSNSVNKLDDPTGLHYEYLKTYSPNLFPIFNIDNVLHQGDIVKVGRNIKYSIDELINDNIIDEKPFISFGKLSIYNLKPEYKLPRIFIPDNVYIYTSSDDTVLPTVLNISQYEHSVAYISTPGNIDTKILDANSALVGKRVNSNLQTLYNWHPGWIWPINVSVSPELWKYRAVKVLEFIKNVTTLDELNKVDLNLWYAGKRVAEIQKYNPNWQTRKDLLNDYTTKVEFVVNTLQNFPEDKRDERFWGAAKKAMMYIGKYNNTGVLEKTSLEEKNFNKYNEFHQWLTKKVNPYCNRNCFEITADRTGIYKLYLKNSEIRKIWPNKEELGSYKNALITYVVKTDEFINTPPKTIEIKPLYQEKLAFPVEIGQLELEKGKTYYIDISSSDKINLVSKGHWIPTEISNQSEYHLEFNPQSVIKGYTTESKDLTIWENTIRYKNIVNWDPDNEYKISFNYQTNEGKLGFSIVEDIYDISTLSEGKVDSNFIDIEDSSVLQKSSLNEQLYSKCNNSNNNDNCWLNYEKNLTSHSLAVGAYIYIYAIPEDKSFSKVVVKDISIEPVLDLKPILVFKANSANINNNPFISYEMINPTRYKINIENATSNYIIVFSQTFHSGWKLYYDKKPIAVDSHEIANGYANAWLITPDEVQDNADYELILEYSPQKIFNLTWGIIISTFTISIGYLLYELVMRKNHRFKNQSMNIETSISDKIRPLAVEVRRLVYIILAFAVSYILFQEILSINSKDSFLTFILVIISTIVILRHKDIAGKYMFFSVVLLIAMTLFILFKQDILSEIFAVWSYTIMLTITIVEIIKINRT